MLTDDRRWGDSTRAPVLADALNQMDRWLTALSDDTSADPKIDKVRRAKPARPGGCVLDTRRQATEDRRTRHVRFRAVRATLSGQFGSARRGRGAGGSDIVKCQLKPIEPVGLQGDASRPDDMARLRRIFPDGVCDWSKPGVEQQRPIESWQTFNAATEAQVASVR